MKTVVLGVAVALAQASAALASAYTDFNTGVAARNAGNAELAIHYLSAAIAAPDLPAHLRATALLDRGECYAVSKQYDAAMVDYSAALALVPSYIGYSSRAALHLQKKEFEPARQDYVSAMRVRPELPNAYVGHGYVNVAERKFDDAIKDYTDALGATLGAPSLYVLRGDAYRFGGRYGEAMKDYATAIQEDPKDPGGYIARGRAYQEQGEFRDALSDYHQALSLTPDDAGARELSGIAQWELGRDRDASDNFVKAGADSEIADYAFLWIYIVREDRAPDALKARAASLDMKQWPAPLVSLVLGGAKPDGVFAQAKNDDPDLQTARLCEADFYVGEWQQIQGNAPEAKRLLGEAAQLCHSEWPEARAARTGLERLGSP